MYANVVFGAQRQLSSNQGKFRFNRKQLVVCAAVCFSFFPKDGSLYRTPPEYPLECTHPDIFISVQTGVSFERVRKKYFNRTKV